MPSLQDWSHDSDRGCPDDSPGSAVTATGLVMINRLREADCSQTAFVEALGDLCPLLVFQCESISPDPTKPELQITVEGNCRSPGPSPTLDRCLHSGNRNQKTIQYPRLRSGSVQRILSEMLRSTVSASLRADRPGAL